MATFDHESASSDPANYIGAHPPEFTLEEAQSIAREHYGLTGAFTPLWGERDQNFAIRSENGPSFVLKIASPRQTAAETDLQLQALVWLENAASDLPVPRIIRSERNAPSTVISGPSGDAHHVYVLSHLDGVQLAQVDPTPETLRASGRIAGRAAVGLRGFFHRAAGHALFWDMRHIGAFARYAPMIRDRAMSGFAEKTALQFDTDIRPALARLRAQVLHHDITAANVLVDPGSPDRVSGLVDFGDILHGPVALDVAVAAIELATTMPDPIQAAAQVVAGYDTELALQEVEIDLLYDLMVARACLGLLIGATRTSHGVTSVDDMDYDAHYIPTLDILLGAGRETVRAALRDACRFPRYTPPAPSAPSKDDTTASLLDRRRAVLGEGLPLTYRTPLHTEKGAGAWLYDIHGRPHLDCYNNVAHVGHCHPHVVRTVARQAATLNTNTRYLFESVVGYAERLGALLPGDLGACLFVNSGSEAVDLALRMAKTVTGQDGMLAIEGAYHGITSESYAVSPATDWGAPGGNARPHVSQTRPDIEMLMNPDTLRGPFRADDPQAGANYAADADRAIATLTTAGHKPGVFIVDTAFSTHGILDVPPDYLPAVAARVGAAGGLIIADEVQYGFGRSGRHFWGFENHGIVPDFVTLGKPIGNGIALGCVVTTPAILERFGQQHEFFSTFGGNPVACAAAGAVLDVIEREGLQQNAHEVGGHLIDGLRAAAHDSDCIGGVRGRGLFVGVDIVTDTTSMTPDGTRCSAIKNHLRDQGILVSSDGFHDNVLKIRPPMVFSRDNADRLIDGIRRAAAET